jgi:hypothetical protein
MFRLILLSLFFLWRRSGTSLRPPAAGIYGGLIDHGAGDQRGVVIYQEPGSE